VPIEPHPHVPIGDPGSAHTPGPLAADAELGNRPPLLKAQHSTRRGDRGAHRQIGARHCRLAKQEGCLWFSTNGWAPSLELQVIGRKRSAACRRPDSLSLRAWRRSCPARGERREMHGDTRVRIGRRAACGRRVWFPIVNQRLTLGVVLGPEVGPGRRIKSQLDGLAPSQIAAAAASADAQRSTHPYAPPLAPTMSLVNHCPVALAGQ
jgi:hypothetical protein